MQNAITHPLNLHCPN